MGLEGSRSCGVREPWLGAGGSVRRVYGQAGTAAEDIGIMRNSLWLALCHIFNIRALIEMVGLSRR